MIGKKLHPYGRVPYGEPGFKFFRGKTGPRAPLQKGCSIAAEQQGEIEDEPKPPEWMADGGYWIFTVLESKDGKPDTIDHLALGIRDGVLFAWLIQADEHYQGDGAVGLLPEDFNWQGLDPAKKVMDLSRSLYAMQPTFPDVEWTLTANIKGREPVVLGTDSEMLEHIKGKLGEN